MPTTLAPSTITPRPVTGPDIQAEMLACALCRTACMPGIEAHYEPALIELSDRRFRGLSLQELLLTCAQANGYQGRHVRQDIPGVMRAAFSSTRLSGILSSVATKMLLSGFNAVEQSWRAICAIRPVKDFKPVESYRLTGADRYQKIPPGGELQHGTLSEERYTNQAETYGRMLSITRQDMINDDLGALSQPARLLGRGAALALNEVFWTTFLDNAAFFTAERNNRISGPQSVLSIDGLSQAEVQFLEQTDEQGGPLGFDPAILLVPPALSAPATALMTSLELRSNLTHDAYPVANPHAGKFQVVRSAYLNTPSVPSGSASTWYLLANPQDAAAIEVAFLNGNETPTIDSAQADFSSLGIQMRGFHDFGIRLQDHRAGIQMMGA